ncbi:MAG: ArsR family transcriptional regulator [Clostridia bacterium]|nr:ArsR family transcriptional regulator [Clostridia bacterium]
MSVKTRREILKLLNRAPCSINDISWKLGIPVSTASFHVKALVEAWLLIYSVNTKKRGNEKLVSLGSYVIALFLSQRRSVDLKYNKVKTVEIPIGSYSSHQVTAPCGMLLKDGEEYLLADFPATFHHPKRFMAKSIWLTQGYLEYTVPLVNYNIPKEAVVEPLDKNSIMSLNLAFEICLETAQYNHDYKSDITLTVNGIEICTFVCQGDYGERRGRFAGKNLPDVHTQYGLLQSLDVRFDGSYLNEKRVSDVCIADLKLKNSDVITFRIEVKKDATHVGGFNLFGKEHGDYPQDILLSLTYQSHGVEVNYNS